MNSMLPGGANSPVLESRGFVNNALQLRLYTVARRQSEMKVNRSDNERAPIPHEQICPPPGVKNGKLPVRAMTRRPPQPPGAAANRHYISFPGSLNSTRRS